MIKHLTPGKILYDVSMLKEHKDSCMILLVKATHSVIDSHTENYIRNIPFTTGGADVEMIIQSIIESLNENNFTFIELTKVDEEALMEWVEYFPAHACECVMKKNGQTVSDNV